MFGTHTDEAHMLSASAFEKFRFTGGRAVAAASVSRKREGSPLTPPQPPRARAKPDDEVSDDPSVRQHPYIAPAPARWRERYAPTCEACEAARVLCVHHPEVSLKLLIIGHNPSEHSWGSGWSYSNPSNNFWKLLAKGRIVPEDWTKEDCPRLPGDLGIGFTDAGTVPGNDAGAYNRATMKKWRSDLYARLRGHVARCADASGDEDARVGHRSSMSIASRHGPDVVAFSGKRQYAQLFDAVPSRVDAGRQPPESLPPGWPLCPGRTEVWVMPSSSGRAAMTREAREGPWVELGARLATIPWPRAECRGAE